MHQASKAFNATLCDYITTQMNDIFKPSRQTSMDGSGANANANGNGNGNGNGSGWANVGTILVCFDVLTAMSFSR